MCAIPMVMNAQEALWLRDIKISPDGRTIAFGYKGDIWTVPVTGGQATRLTTMDTYEQLPVWSPDGKTIAFASDRHGNMDVFAMPATGGRATRLTANSANELPEGFTPDGKQVLYSAAIQDPAESALFPSLRLTELYAVDLKGKKSTQVLASPAQIPSWVSGKKGGFGEPGASMLYVDQKGMEDQWRKHHTSSVTRDIWLYDAATGKHTNVTKHAGEDRDPVSAGDGQFYFLSERNGGSMNVYKADISDASDPVAVTSFKTHPVRFLSRADNGTLAYGYNGEIYTQAPGAKPVKIEVLVTEDTEEPISKLTGRSGASNVALSPDGKSVAFTYRGDVYVTSVEYATTKQITSTPQAESDVAWNPDGQSLVYVSERDGKFNIYEARMGRPDDEANFANATTIVEKRLFGNDGHERTAPAYSPDGKKLAYILDRNKLYVRDVKSGKDTRLTDGSTYRTRNGRFNYVWSPDSKRIAAEIVDRQHDPYYDIAVIDVNNGNLTNITNSGYFDEAPRWTHDGNAIMFLSERYGMRNHASWGSQYDVMLAFLNQDAYDKFTLNEEDYAITKELAKKSKDKKEAEVKADSLETIIFEPLGVEERTVRLTPSSGSLKDAFITADGEVLYYITRNADGPALWKKNLRKSDHKMVTKADGMSGFDLSKDGKTVLIAGSSMKKFDPKSDKLTPVTYAATMNLDRAKEREYMFDYVTREERERFYRTDMHGVDWDMMTRNYRRFLPHINNNYDFAELLSEMLGELNVSHTGGRYSPYITTDADRTASLGLFYDLKYDGPGMKIAEVIAGGPLDKAMSKAQPGTVLVCINGIQVNSPGGDDLTTLLTDQAGKKTLLAFKDADGKTWEEVVLPISAAKQNNLLYERWVKAREADVERLSGGRLGYVHIRSMGDDSFRDVYSKVLGKYNDRDGIVIDIRWNGGGRLHEDIEVLFSGNKYFQQEIRGVRTCDMPSRRWNKPSIMIMNEACYSNAHGTPWVYSHQELGKLVGAPVPGTMTSVNWVTMQDPTMVFGIPVIGYRLPDGSFLENQQLEPDVLILNDPATVVKGEDTQLRTAVEELLKEIDAVKKHK